MNDDEFEARLEKLIKEIAGLPKDKQKKLGPIVNETKQRHRNIKESADRVTQSLSSLRICLKYLLFDLEATRRERDKMKKMLDNNSSNDDKPSRADGGL